MKQSQRSKRLSKLIQRSLATILLYYRDNPLISKVTITDVEVAADLSTARIFICLLHEKDVKPTLQELRSETHNLRHLLARELNLRITPHLNFVYDRATVEGQRLSLLIDKAVVDDELMK